MEEIVYYATIAAVIAFGLHAGNHLARSRLQAMLLGLAAAWRRRLGPSCRRPQAEPAEGLVDLIVNPSSCVQCGAITAKGGRLTPPEGGDGPVYQVT